MKFKESRLVKGNLNRKLNWSFINLDNQYYFKNKSIRLSIWIFSQKNISSNYKFFLIYLLSVIKQTSILVYIQKLHGSRKDKIINKVHQNLSSSTSPQKPKRVNWKDRFVKFAEKVGVNTPNIKTWDDSHYFSNDINIKSNKSSIIIQWGNTRSFVSDLK